MRCLETPSEIRSQIWRELGRATKDRHHPWRTPVFATARADGSVNARTVVLRGVQASEGLLQIFTDARSPKAAELVSQPSAVFVFWSVRLGWQLRVRVNVALLTQGVQVERLWDRVKQSASAADYLSPCAPGSPLSATAQEDFQETSHFAVLNAQVTEMDWLELAKSGHRRARLTSETWEWLAP